MLYEDVKVICKVMSDLLNKMLFVDVGVDKNPFLVFFYLTSLLYF